MIRRGINFLNATVLRPSLLLLGGFVFVFWLAAGSGILSASFGPLTAEDLDFLFDAVAILGADALIFLLVWGRRKRFQEARERKAFRSSQASRRIDTDWSK